MTLYEVKRQLWSALEEYQDSLIDFNEVPESAFEDIDKVKENLFCFDGHTTIDDHCGLPEHRFCFFCGKLTPNAAKNW